MNQGDLTLYQASATPLVSQLNTRWQAVSDMVMGGLSQAGLEPAERDGEGCLRLFGDVRVENRGGFIQMGLDLTPGGGVIDASAYSGLRLRVLGNGERYSVHLRTADVYRPWQSYRAHFATTGQWQTLSLPFARFTPHRIDLPLDLTRLRRLGVVAIGRPFRADLCLAEVVLYR